MLKHILISILLVVNVQISVADDTIYSFGIVPQQSAKRLAQLWTPVLNYVSQESGVKLQFKTAKNIPEFEKRLSAGEYDFSYMNPYHFTVFNRNPGYQAVAVRDKQPIRGIVVVKKDSKYQSISDLENTTLAFPSPAAFAASVLPRAKFANDNINISPKYVSSHDSVYLNVAKGIFPAGGGVGRTFNNTPEPIRSQLKVLWTTDPYTPHAIASHPRVEKEHLASVKKAFLNMKNTEKGKELLKTLKLKNGLIEAKNEDWDDVRSLGIDLLEKLINE